MSPIDAALLERWSRHSDAEAFDELISRYAGFVYGTCLRIMRNASDAEDVTQECFLRIAEAHPEIHTSLGGWLHRLATTRSLNRIREERRRSDREEKFAENVAASTETVWNDIQDYVDEAINALDEDRRDILVQHFLRQRSYADIASDLNVSRQAVSQRAKRGIDEIRAALTDRGVTLAAATLSSLFAERSVLAVPQHLIAALGKVGIAGIEPTAVLQAAASGAIKHGGVSLMTKIALGTGFLALIAALTTIRPANTSETTMTPPPVGSTASSNSVANLNLQSDDDPGSQDPLLLAQSTDPSPTISPRLGDIDSGPLPEWYEPDYRKFSLTRPKPPPGTGSFHFAVAGVESVGVIASLYRISWRYWEVVPDDVFRLDKVVPESRVVTFNNLPFGNYHIALKGEYSGGNWMFALSERSPMYVDVIQLAPRFPTTFRVIDSEGNPIPNPLMYGYTNATYGRLIPFLLSPRGTRGDESGIIARSIARDRKKMFITATGYAPSISRWFEGGEQNIEVVLTEGGTVKGRVVDAISGAGVPGTIVYLVGDHYRDSCGNWTDEEGNLTVRNIRPGRYRLFLHDSTLVMTNPPQLIDIREGETTTAGTIEAAPGVLLRGRVYDEETEEGISGVRVDATSLGRLPRRDIVTDDEGYYEISNASFSEYTLTRIPTDTYGSGSGLGRITLKVGPDGPNQSADFPLRKGIPFAGRIVDRNGRGVSGATVVALGNRYPTDVRTVAGRSGAFNLSGIRSPGTFSIMAYGPGYARAQFGPFDLTEEGLSTLTLQLAPGAAVQGRIVDEKGNTVAPATVTATRTDIEMTSPAVSSFSRPNSRWMGRFFVPNLPQGSYSFSAQPRRGGVSSTVFTGLQLREGELRHGVEMVYQVGGLTIAGQVFDPSGAPVSLANIQFDSQAFPGGYGSYSTTTDPEGTFAMSGLANRDYTLRVTHSEYSKGEVYGVQAGDRNVRIQLQGRGEVSGRVLAVDGSPVERFTLYHLDRADAQFDVSMLSEFRNISNENGEFKLDDVQAGVNTLFAKAEGFAVASVVLPDVQPGRPQFGITLQLEVAPLISGVVSNESGEPVAGALVYDSARYINYDMERYSIARTDGDGRFATEVMQAGEVSLVFTHADYTPTILDVLLESGLETSFEITLLGGSSVYGLVSIEGEPVANGNVSLYGDSNSIERRYKSTAIEDGQYRFDKVSAGDAWINVQIPHRGGTRSIRTLVAIDSSVDIILDFAFENHWSGIEGTISATDSLFDPRMTRLSASVNDEQFSGRVAEDGTFALHGLPWGDVKLVVHSEDLGVRTFDLRLADGEIVTQDVVLGN